MPATDPATLLRSPRYIMLLIFAAALGIPVAVAAYGFLTLVHFLQEWTFQELPVALGFVEAPPWWPLPVLAVAGLVVALTIRYLPGQGGHSPADGFSAVTAAPSHLPGVIVAALTGLGLGVILGPEAPLVAIGGGLAVAGARLLRRDLPERTEAVVGAAGSFAAISTLLGSPIIGAFLLMEAAGIAGPALGVLLVPGLLASGVGSLIFIGLGNWTGLGTFSLAATDVATMKAPTVSEFGWALVIGVAGAVLGLAIRRSAQRLQGPVSRRRIPLTIAAGVLIALAAMAYEALTGHGAQEILFSGQDALGPLLTSANTYSVGALVAIVVAKGFGFTIALAAFRGGPVFPAVLIGAAGGLAMSALPGLSPTAGAAMGIGALSVVMLGLPLTSVLLATLVLGADGVTAMPLTIVAVVVAYVVTARLSPTSGESESLHSPSAGSISGQA